MGEQQIRVTWSPRT